MPSVGQDRAQFDSVSDSGDLIFKHNGSTFTVSVDDVLEHAILEARQIKAESLKAQEPQPPVALPISQIQSAIRAGTDPSRVVQRFGVSPALVRRFSAPVETEKQYAIDQFLSVNASKAYQSGNIAGVISDSLDQMGIDMTSVSWKATRRGLEPWRIVAQFDAAGRQIRAQWSWNMHDNTVEPLNPAARRLLGESEQVSATHTSESGGRTVGNPTSPKSSPNVHRDARKNGRVAQHDARAGTVQAKAGRTAKHRDVAEASTPLTAKPSSTGKPSSDSPKSVSASGASGNHSTDTSVIPSQHRSRHAQRHAVTVSNNDGSEQHGQVHGHAR